MPRRYSTDLRERVLLACEQHEGSRAQIAQRFGIGESTVDRWPQQARQEGRRAAKPARGGRAALGGHGLEVLKTLAAEDNDATLAEDLAEDADRWVERTGRRASRSALCRALRQLGWRRKKKTLRAQEWDQEEVARNRLVFREKMAKVNIEDWVFIDESGVDTTLTRSHARAPEGQRALGTVPFGHWDRLTLLGALARDGMVAVMTIAAATTTAVFQAFVEPVLLPAVRQRRPGAVVVLDHLQPHKAAPVRDALQAAGIQVPYLPPNSPDVSPIEPCWSKLKTALRAREARSLGALDAALPAVLDTVTAQDAAGWFAHCGYAALN